jgi:hypothetical protein
MSRCVSGYHPRNRDRCQLNVLGPIYSLDVFVTIRTQRVQQVKTETVTDAPNGFETRPTVEADTRFRCQAKPDVMVHCASYQ